jgi:hypothetical protein
MSNNIAIVGTRGAGKTVFTTVLANYLSTPKNGVLLIPKTYDIEEYVALNYAKLQRGEWLDSTNLERKLSWKLRTPGQEEQELSLVDCPGEDIQRLFARREFESEQSGASRRDKALVEYLLSATKVLLLINLKDFIDESFEEDDVRRRKLREHSLKEFLSAVKESQSHGTHSPLPVQSSRDGGSDDNRVSGGNGETGRHRRHVAVLFTAYNQHRDHIEKRFGDIPRFLAKRLPALYYEHFDGQGGIGFPVSAVANTTNEGYPARGFKSEGFEAVVKWLISPTLYLEGRGKSHDGSQSKVKQEQAKSASEPRIHEW